MNLNWNDQLLQSKQDYNHGQAGRLGEDQPQASFAEEFDFSYLVGQVGVAVQEAETSVAEHQRCKGLPVEDGVNQALI